MLKPLNKDTAFAAIADDLELPLVLLSNADSRVRLVQLKKIGAALASTNLTWRDLAERVTAPRPTAVQPPRAQPPAPPAGSFPRTSERRIGPETVLSNEELAPFGYRTRGPGYGFEGTEIPGADEPPPIAV